MKNRIALVSIFTILSISTQAFPAEFILRMFDNSTFTVVFDGRRYNNVASPFQLKGIYHGQHYVRIIRYNPYERRNFTVFRGYISFPGNTRVFAVIDNRFQYRVERQDALFGGPQSRYDDRYRHPNGHSYNHYPNPDYNQPGYNPDYDDPYDNQPGYDERNQGNYDNRNQPGYDNRNQPGYDNRNQSGYPNRSQQNYDNRNQRNYNNRNQQPNYDNRNQQQPNYDNRNQSDYDNRNQNQSGGYNQNQNNSNVLITDIEFSRLTLSMQKASFSSERADLALVALQNSLFTSSQVAQMIKMMQFDSDKLKVAKAGYDRVTDRKNFHVVLDGFAFSSTRQEMMDYMKNR